MRETIAISIDADLANEIDEKRGLISRSSFCEDLLKKGLLVNIPWNPNTKENAKDSRNQMEL